MACNTGYRGSRRGRRICFNPWRVFSWLATTGLQKGVSGISWVSIPGGFFRGLQLKVEGGPPSVKVKFQSLAGFFVACNKADITMIAKRWSSFNPWRVFSWLATKALELFEGWSYGFNPWRVFSWLATYKLGVKRHCRKSVSIPGGFFRGLQLLDSKVPKVDREVFQSLAGFFVACNDAARPGYGDVDLFQSLAGFFVACNSPTATRPWKRSTCFNPWRVFSWLATMYFLIASEM